MPVNEWAQFAVPTLLSQGDDFLKQYQKEICLRKELAVSILSGAEGLSVMAPEGGFYMTVKINDPKINEEKIALALLEQEGILVHPGYFYDLPAGYLVICFVSKPRVLKKVLRTALRFGAAHGVTLREARGALLSDLTFS